ncbi:GNAT family N-acetyltransferase [Leisingera sp. S232]|uniref:GNAT family N-acetyltransferase n=1 Tax=Leisingera sp. S232 TaxID=3415132 RepID=UPI003C7CAB55
MERINEYGQPVGASLEGWGGAAHPGHKAMLGTYAKLVPLDPVTHTQDLFSAYREDPKAAIWTYMANGPYNTASGLQNWISQVSGSDEQPFFAVVDQNDNTAKGVASFLRIDPLQGVMEIGSITFAPGLQRTRVATEAIFLMMQRALGELGYRRLEWKCDALNAPSRRAAERFGFTYDGLFEQAVIYKGRNRDTAWYSLLDKDWAPVERGFLAWLAKENFDGAGQQCQRLADFINAERQAAAG